jgi:Putative adhesin
MIERTYETPGPLRLDLTVPAGSVEVETVDGDVTEVSLDCDNERDLADATVELRQRGDGHELVVAAERRMLLGGLVPISIGSFSVGGHEYRLRVRCPHGADLAVRTASANVAARGRYGEADVKTTSGGVSLGEFSSSVAVKTVSGDATIERVAGKLTTQLVSGDLRVNDTANAVQTKTISGDVQIVVAEGSVELTTVSGDIEVGVRRGSRLHVDANSVSGDLDSEVPLAGSPDDADAGGPLVELRAKTVSGDFRVVRA